MKSLKFYSSPGKVTDLKDFRNLIEPLTDNPDYICQMVQGLLVHGGWLDRYGVEYRAERDVENVSDMGLLLERILDLNDSPLSFPRLPQDRVIASCREYATLAVAIMRAKRIPARCRVGFASYLGSNGEIEDHWIVEYWNGKRWILTDPQIDPTQLSFLQKLGHNTIILDDDTEIKCPYSINPRFIKERYDFLNAATIWLTCRKGSFSPDKCGIGTHRGYWFIRGQVLRDFAALNKVETVPYLCRIEKGLDWSEWEYLGAEDKEISVNDFSNLDMIAFMGHNADYQYENIRKYYDKYEYLRVPESYYKRIKK